MATPEESPEPTSFWSHKPWWCQPWTILMTGSLAIGGSWWLLHWLWLTLPIALLVLIWWWLFLIVVPGLRRPATDATGTMSDSIRLQAIDQSLFDRVAAVARQKPRRRMNHNLHQESDLVQRFLNVLQPGTYVRPHRHVREQAGTGFECFLVLQGAIGLLIFDGDGQLIERHRLSATGPLRGIELAENQFHSLVALEPDTVMFELKQGPYQPTQDKDFLSAFPGEGSEQAEDQERSWRQLFATGHRP